MTVDMNTPPAYAPPTLPSNRGGRRPAAIALVIAGLVLAAAGGFLAGRATAPEKEAAAPVATTQPVSGSSETTAPADPNADLLAQALTLHQNGKIDEASALYKQIITADPTNKFAWFNLGQIAQTRNNLDEALTNYNEALKIDPVYGPALYNGGLAYAAKGDRKNAIDLLKRAVDTDPKSAPALYNLGTVMVADGQTAEGTKYLEQAFAIDPSLKPAS